MVLIGYLTFSVEARKTSNYQTVKARINKIEREVDSWKNGPKEYYTTIYFSYKIGEKNMILGNADFLV